MPQDTKTIQVQQQSRYGTSKNDFDVSELAEKPPSSSKNRAVRIYHIVLTVMWLAVAGYGLYSGLGYYTLPLQEKAFSEMHDLYKPSGLVGQGFGIIGSLMMIIGVATYSMRKRAASMGSIGKLKYWLEFHIFLCTLGPFLVMLHTSFKFGGIVSIAFWSMAIVMFSGIFGRYVYIRIPKTVNGVFITARVIQNKQRQMLDALHLKSGLPVADIAVMLKEVRMRPPRGFLDALFLTMKYDFTRRKRGAKIETLLCQHNLDTNCRNSIHKMIMEDLQLQQQMTIMQPFQKLFGYWHVLHLPLAIIMFLIMIGHIAVAILFGYTWIF